MEYWRTIDEYDGDYEVSNLGNVRSRKLGRCKNLSLITHHTGYIKVNLYKNGTPRQYSVNVLVAKAFVPNLKDKPQTNHIDGDKSNNRAKNLEWCTASENHVHAHKLGLIVSPFKGKRGNTHTQNKVSSNDVLQMRSVYEQGWFEQTEIAKAYGIAPNTVSTIINRHTWKHI